jgi:phage replication-related protein YjqB (UPF0714/DUF867 family)
MTIQVTIKNVYGNRLIYPACNKAKAFAHLTGKKTLSDYNISTIKRLGYTVEVIAPTL